MKHKLTGAMTDEQKQKRRETMLAKTDLMVKTTPFETLAKHHWYKRLLWEQNNQCAICQRDDTWEGRPLRFQIDHIEGRQHGDHRSNLRLLCPNCHSQTPTFGSKNTSPEGRIKMQESMRQNRRFMKKYKGEEAGMSTPASINQIGVTMRHSSEG